MSTPAPSPESPAAARTATEKIAVLDCGAQYTKVIDRRVRELKVETEIFPLDVDPARLEDFSGIIISGGPGSVYEADAPKPHPDLFSLQMPILGICYGMQLINRSFGGMVQSGETKEYGETVIDVKPDTLLFKDLDPKQQVLMSHGDRVETLAPGFEVIGESHGIVAAIANREKRVYGVQFHPEVELTEHGTAILRNFLYEACKVSGTFTLEDRLEQTVEEIRKTVGDREVFVLVSGGVDSSVTAALLLKALGPEKVFAVHIDSGFMRHEESDLVCEALKAIGLKHLRRINAEQDFLNAVTEMEGEMEGKTVGPLKTETDPEAKRRIIGDVFYRLISRAMEEAEINLDEAFIAQGTLRPDLIESGNRGISTAAHKIKTHHNDVPVIQQHRDRGLIIEPNRDLHKDEVRRIGQMLGLPTELVIRQPFPGPGLAIRVLCTDQPFITENFDATNQALRQKAKKNGFDGLLLPVKSVGVQGDGRSYSYLAVLSGEDYGNWRQLKDLAREIPNELHAINRVAVVVNGKQLPERWERVTPTTLLPETTQKLRDLDHIVTEAFKRDGLFEGISQLLTVLVPVDTTGGNGHSIAIRAVVTSDYMTARPAALGSEIPLAFIRKLGQELGSKPGVDLVMYDVTSKPPATVEWE